MFKKARMLIEAGARLNTRGVGCSPLAAALEDGRRYENGLTSLLLIANAREIPDGFDDPKKVLLPHHYTDLFQASYHELVHVVAFQNDPAIQGRTHKPKRNALTTEQYAEIMRKRLANLTDPEELLECTTRLRYLEEPVASSWRTFRLTKPWVEALDDNMPAALTDITLEYALPTLGPIMYKKRQSIELDDQGNRA